MNNSLELNKDKDSFEKSEEIREFFDNRNDSNNSQYSNFLYVKNSGKIKYNNSWDFYFRNNTNFDFSIQGLNNLKREIFIFYIKLFCFDEKEITIKSNYILGLSNVNDLDEISKNCDKKEHIRLICQIFKKDELVKIKKQSDFFKLFKHYFIWSLNKSFEIGKIKNKYKKSKFLFESIESIIDNLKEEVILPIENKINQKFKNPSNMNILQDELIDSKVELLNNEKIPNLYYELTELKNDEKNFCIIKEYKDENGSYYQGSIYNKNNTSIDSSNSNHSKNIINSNNENIISDCEKEHIIANNNKLSEKRNLSQEFYKKHGLGKEYHINISNNKDIRYKYIGYYKNNKFHGFGILVKENDECYFGEFRDGLKNGFGLLHTPKYIYKGFFYKDKKEGYGEYFNKEENTNYCGNFHDDKFNGYGYYYKENIFKFFGNFFEGNIKGLGLYIWKSNDQYYGNWLEDKMNGIGIYFYKGGDIFIGNYFDDKKDGKGKYIYKGKKSMLEGEWKNGIKHGKYKFIFFKDGNLNSTDIRYINNMEIS